MFLLIACVLFFVFYSAVIIFYSRSWKAIPHFNISGITGNTKFSVIIPARNEEKNITRLLNALQKQTYPKHLFEVIVIDDHSDDHTVEAIKKFQEVRLFSLKDDTINSYKKKAIEIGIAAATNEWIVCTDADCIVPENWLTIFSTFIQQKNPVFIAAPVNLIPDSSTFGFRKMSQRKRNQNRRLYIFQTLDFMVLQGITGASVYKKMHSMCNGANLAYRKDVFEEVNGFKGVDDIAGGDDMLLMYKIWKKYPDRIDYIKSREAIVQTNAAPTWRSFFNQRIRWASKATHYDEKKIFWILLLVYGFNFSFLILLIASFFDIKYFVAIFVFIVAKTFIEFPFIKNVSRFFDHQKPVKYFFFFQPVHIAYTIISGFFGSFGKYEWKGRRVK